MARPALVSGAKRTHAVIRGRETPHATHAYRAWAFEQVQRSLLALAPRDRAWADDVLTRTELLPGLLADGVVHSDLYDGLTPPIIRVEVPQLVVWQRLWPPSLS